MQLYISLRTLPNRIISTLVRPQDLCLNWFLQWRDQTAMEMNEWAEDWLSSLFHYTRTFNFLFINWFLLVVFRGKEQKCYNIKMLSHSRRKLVAAIKLCLSFWRVCRFLNTHKEQFAWKVHFKKMTLLILTQVNKCPSVPSLFSDRWTISLSFDLGITDLPWPSWMVLSCRYSNQPWCILQGKDYL